MFRHQLHQAGFSAAPDACNHLDNLLIFPGAQFFQIFVPQYHDESSSFLFTVPIIAQFIKCVNKNSETGIFNPHLIRAFQNKKGKILFISILLLGNDFSVNQFLGIIELGNSNNDLIADMEIFIFHQLF